MKKQMKILWLFLMLLTVVLLIYQQREQLNFSQFYMKNRSEEMPADSILSMEYDPVEYNLFSTYEEDIIHCTKDGIKRYTTAGKQVWSQTYTIAKPKLVKSEPYLAVGDVEGYYVIVMNQDGKVYDVKTQYPILSFEINPVGNLAVLTKVEDGHHISVYNKAGALFLERPTFVTQDGYPVGFALSPDGDKMVTNYVDTNGSEVISKITFFEISQKGEAYIDHIIGSYNYTDVFFAQVAYMNKDTVVAIGDERVVAFNTAEKPDEIWSHVVSSKINFGALQPKNFFVLSFGDPLPGKESAQQGLTVIYDLNGKQIADFDAQDPVTYLYGDEDQVVIGTDRSFYAITEKGKKMWEYTAVRDIQQVIPFYRETFGKSQKVLMISKDHFEVIEIGS